MKGRHRWTGKWTKRAAAAVLAAAMLLTACATAGASALYGATTLRPGARSDDVRRLQEDLKALDYYKGSVTGHYGGMTQEAVRQFQKKNGLTADGIAGPRTFARLSQVLGGAYGDYGAPGTSAPSASSGLLTLGSSGDAVRALQENLQLLKFYKSTVTGHYGSLTKEAVRQFQKKNGLTADGVAGPRTLDKIYQLLADAPANGSGTAGGSGSTGSGSTGSAGSAGSTGTTGPTLLDRGSSGDIVRALQENLHSLGYYDGVISGSYGNKTKEAVRQFQKDCGLTADGIAGPRTLARISEEIAKKAQTPAPETTPAPEQTGTLLDEGKTLRQYERSDDVRKMQDALARLGYFKSTSTGYFGTETLRAVKDFQRAKGLSVDGVAGKRTLAAINEALRNGGLTVASGAVD